MPANPAQICYLYHSFSNFSFFPPSFSKYFHQRQLAFALGVSVAVAALSKMLSKATVAPVAEYFGTYKASLVYVAFFQVCSICCV